MPVCLLEEGTPFFHSKNAFVCCMRGFSGILLCSLQYIVACVLHAGGNKQQATSNEQLNTAGARKGTSGELAGKYWDRL